MSNKLVWWGYAVELLATALTVTCLSLWFQPNAVVAFVRIAAIDIATLFCAVMLAAALAFLWSFYTKADTPFYRWLEERGAFNVYLSGTVYTIAVSFTTTAALIVAKYVEGLAIGLIATFMLVLSILNLYSLVYNVAGIMRLNAKFNSIARDM
ncbi:hypothetical protein RQP53_12000 [Paucibacter sp. APW11]|uniref:GtrA-like protein domain-containing protein n=1 Tax=Roseateles aquae TaxID=3077235 RepID=A0ABU3PBU0_9BURK|nr:hypothetical protein [Paucibacter sp. APW11]MDT8999988.1 hypothetical protein [Paucibacter sp. APW11]